MAPTPPQQPAPVRHQEKAPVRTATVGIQKAAIARRLLREGYTEVGAEVVGRAPEVLLPKKEVNRLLCGNVLLVDTQYRTRLLSPRLSYISMRAVAATPVRQFPPIVCAAMNEAIRVVLKRVSTRICMTTTCTTLAMHSESATLEAGLHSSNFEVNKPGLRLQRRLWMLSESWAAGGKLRPATSARELALVALCTDFLTTLCLGDRVVWKGDEVSLAPCRPLNAVRLCSTDTAELPLWTGRLVRSGAAYGEEAYVIVSGKEEALTRSTRLEKKACTYARKRQALFSRLHTLVFMVCIISHTEKGPLATGYNDAAGKAVITLEMQQTLRHKVLGNGAPGTNIQSRQFTRAQQRLLLQLQFGLYTKPGEWNDEHPDECLRFEITIDRPSSAPDMVVSAIQHLSLRTRHSTTLALKTPVGRARSRISARECILQ
ncbi:hypothetical protein CGC21_34720 [Leishmania donovani]|uniref:Uncharacterized protein n=1 Tax=Leishmania donovani TaxID=5661 RepID=A0A504XKS7_LEIDO|nr:hypothetical protein CGC21_34720 [Leishmania donovani]